MTADSVFQKFWQEVPHDRVRIAFFGDFSGGKTSLLERMLQADYLPSREVPTTAHPMCLRKGNREVRVHYKDGLVQEVKGDDDTLTYSLANRYEAENVSFYEVFEPNFSWGKGVEVWDTPGSNSVHEGHGERASLLHEGADLVVYVLNAQKPLTESDRAQIAKLQEGNSADRPIFFLLNKIDRLSEDEMTLEELIEDLSESIKSKVGVDKFYIFPVSAKLYREPKLQEFVPDERFDDFVNKLILYRDHLLEGKISEKKSQKKQEKKEQKARRKETQKQQRQEKGKGSLVTKLKAVIGSALHGVLRWGLAALFLALLSLPYLSWSHMDQPWLQRLWGPATNLVLAQSLHLPYLTQLAQQNFDSSHKDVGKRVANLDQKIKQQKQKMSSKQGKGNQKAPKQKSANKKSRGEHQVESKSEGGQRLAQWQQERSQWHKTELLFAYAKDPKIRQKYQASSHPALIYQDYKLGKVSLDFLLIKSGQALLVYLLVWGLAVAGLAVAKPLRFWGLFHFLLWLYWLGLVIVAFRVGLSVGYSADAELRLGLYAFGLLPFLVWFKGRKKNEQ